MSFGNTKRNIEEPVTVAVPGYGRDNETKTTHPAFGQVSVSRVSGRTNLYGSDFGHSSYVTLTINQSELHRNLSNDWFFARDQVVEITLSEAQWATLVSAFGVGGGVPCTLTWLRDVGRLPELPDPTSRADQFGKEFQKDFAESLQALKELEADLEASGLSKKKIDALVSKTRTAYAKITSSAPFVADQFGEHMETEMERAKVEIHGYAQNLFARAGVAALAGGTPITLGIEDRSDDR